MVNLFQSLCHFDISEHHKTSFKGYSHSSKLDIIMSTFETGIVIVNLFTQTISNVK